MPEKDGFDLIAQVRDLGYDETKLPAVALTAFVQKDDARLPDGLIHPQGP